ncbi:MAG: queuosine precursor transporter [Candidatus Levyibacteriota bacterium]
MLKIEKLDFLVSVYIFCICASELMGAKTFPLVKVFGYQLNASVAIFVLPFIYSINDVVVEVLGLDKARSIVRSGLIVVVMVLFFSLLFTSLPPSTRFAVQEKSYDSVFGLSARISAASLTAFIIAEFTDVFIFFKLRQKLGKKALWLRNNLSNFISEFLDTAIFMALAFYAFDKPFMANVNFLFSLILPYWLIKCFMSIIETPLVYAGVSWLRGKEKK